MHCDEAVQLATPLNYYNMIYQKRLFNVSFPLLHVVISALVASGRAPLPSLLGDILFAMTRQSIVTQLRAAVGGPEDIRPSLNIPL